MSASHAVSAAASAGRLGPRARARSVDVSGSSSRSTMSTRGVMGVSTAGLRFGSRAGRRAGDRSRAGVVYARVETREKPTGGIADMSSQMKQMRAQMEEDEDLNTLMAGLRGSNIDDSDFAADGVKMQVVDLEKLKAAGDDELPLYYDPELIAQYWSKRPAATAQRILDVIPTSPDLNLLAAKAHARAGDRDAALNHLQVYLDVMRNADEGHSRVAEATNLLQQLTPRS